MTNRVVIPRGRENDAELQKVAIGLECQHFITHDRVGQHLIERANVMRINALEQLATADPTNPDRIRELQNQARIPDLFLQWLDEAIAEGENAELAVRESEQDY